MHPRRMFRAALRNSIATLVVFLPTVIVGAVLSTWWRGDASLKERVLYHASAMLVTYITFVPSVIVGSIGYNLLLLVIPLSVKDGIARIAAVVLAFAVPLLVILLGLPGVFYLPHFPGPTVLGAFLLGLVSDARMGRGGRDVPE